MAQPAPARRFESRIDVDGFCLEIANGRERHGAVLDLSESGLCLERPFRTGGFQPLVGQSPTSLPGGGTGTVQLELEVPELDEVIWANAHVRFDQVIRRRDAGPGLLRRTGLALGSLARRDANLIRDYLAEKRHRIALATGDVFDFTLATCFNRG